MNTQFGFSNNNNNFNNTFGFPNQFNNNFNFNNNMSNNMFNNQINNNIFHNNRIKNQTFPSIKMFNCPKCNQMIEEGLKEDHLLSHQIDEQEKGGKLSPSLNRENDFRRNLRDAIVSGNVLNFVVPNRRNNIDNNLPEPNEGNNNNQPHHRNIQLIIRPSNQLNNDPSSQNANDHHRNILIINPRTHSALLVTNLNNNNFHGIPMDFPEIVIEDVSKLEEGNKRCTICLEDFQSKEKVTALPCIHLFHTS